MIRLVRIRRSRRKSAKNAKPSREEGDGAMSVELQKLVKTIPNANDRKRFNAEMRSFLDLYNRHLSERRQQHDLDWGRISPPSADYVTPYHGLTKISKSGALEKLAILKVNGGLGTSMSIPGAKSALEVKNGLTFLDLVLQQIEHLNLTYSVSVPLILMTSFHTEDDTRRIVAKYTAKVNEHKIDVTMFNQSRYPRVVVDREHDSMRLWPKHASDDNQTWYPAGHGDVYNALKQSGVLERLLAQGKEYLFISNADNLGAVVDQTILQHVVDSEAEFVMEVTNRTRNDVKSATLVEYDGKLQLLDFAQVSEDHKGDFESAGKFKVFNTNNLWINLKALKRVMESVGMELDIIANPKETEDGHSILQLETAAGAAIKHFKTSHAINVPRTRFLPVRTCADLLLIKSDLYTLRNGQLVSSEKRMFQSVPDIKLGDHFRKVREFRERFKNTPSIVELDHLTVAGDVYFGRDVTMKGTVIIIAAEGQRIDIPDGCVLENRLMSGELTMIDI